jgi:copper chaperone NosL
MMAGRPWRRVLALALLCGLGCGVGCGGGPVRPAALDTENDQCASCRMIVSDARFAAQVAAPGEEPRFFDDLRCLREGLRSAPLPKDAVVFVTDVRTGAWVRASSAVYAILPGVETPMASHWVAWADEGSRRADPGARDGTAIAAEEVLGPTPGGGVGP